LKVWLSVFLINRSTCGTFGQLVGGALATHSVLQLFHSYGIFSVLFLPT